MFAEELEVPSLVVEVLPPDLSRFESHLRQPVRMHNIREKMQKSGKFQSIITENNSEVDRTGLVWSDLDRDMLCCPSGHHREWENSRPY